MIFHAVDSSMIVFTATHSPSLRVEMVGFCKAGSTEKHAGEVLLAHVEHQADPPLGIDCAGEHQGKIFNLPGVSRRQPRQFYWR